MTLCHIQDHVAEAKPPAEAKAIRASADTSQLQEFFKVGGQVMVHQGYQKYTGLLGSWLAQSLRLPLPRARARWLDGSGGRHFPHQVPLWSWTLSQLHVCHPLSWIKGVWFISFGFQIFCSQLI